MKHRWDVMVGLALGLIVSCETMACLGFVVFLLGLEAKRHHDILFRTRPFADNFCPATCIPHL